MRMMLKAEWPIDAGNAKIRDGSLPDTIQSILDEQKPEAVYFLASNGKRTALLFIDINDPSELPGIAEPWFLAFNASLECTPAMTPEDLAKAGPAIEAAVKKYG